MKKIKFPLALETYRIDPSLFSSDQKFPPWLWNVLDRLKGQEFQLIEIAKPLGLTWTEAEPLIKNLTALPQFTPVEQIELCYSDLQKEAVQVGPPKETGSSESPEINLNSLHSFEVIEEHDSSDQNQSITLEF